MEARTVWDMWRCPTNHDLLPMGTPQFLTHSWLTWMLKPGRLRGQHLWSHMENYFLSLIIVIVIFVLICKVGTSILWKNGKFGEKASVFFSSPLLRWGEGHGVSKFGLSRLWTLHGDSAFWRETWGSGWQVSSVRGQDNSLRQSFLEIKLIISGLLL